MEAAAWRAVSQQPKADQLGSTTRTSKTTPCKLRESRESRKSCTVAGRENGAPPPQLQAKSPGDHQATHTELWASTACLMVALAHCDTLQSHGVLDKLQTLLRRTWVVPETIFLTSEMKKPLARSEALGGCLKSSL